LLFILRDKVKIISFDKQFNQNDLELEDYQIPVVFATQNKHN